LLKQSNAETLEGRSKKLFRVLCVLMLFDMGLETFLKSESTTEFITVAGNQYE
jgi:hypothetical protein